MSVNNQTQSWNQPSWNKKNDTKNQQYHEFFKKISKIDKPLAKLTKEHKDSIQINKIKNEKKNRRSETEEVNKIIRT